MKKILFTMSILVILLTMSNCKEDPVEETYDINSGVYPYEVTDIKYTIKSIDDDKISDPFGKASFISWKNPTNKNFSSLKISYLHDAVIFDENNVDTGERGEGFFDYLESFLIINDRNFKTIFEYVIIKCVDKYGNVSEGIRFDYPL
jgi:hypothetical protein